MYLHLAIRRSNNDYSRASSDKLNLHGVVRGPKQTIGDEGVPGRAMAAFGDADRMAPASNNCWYDH